MGRCEYNALNCDEKSLSWSFLFMRMNEEGRKEKQINFGVLIVKIMLSLLIAQLFFPVFSKNITNLWACKGYVW